MVINLNKNTDDWSKSTFKSDDNNKKKNKNKNKNHNQDKNKNKNNNQDKNKKKNKNKNNNNNNNNKNNKNNKLTLTKIPKNFTPESQRPQQPPWRKMQGWGTRDPIALVYGISYLPTSVVDFHGKCRKFYTWIRGIFRTSCFAVHKSYVVEERVT